MPDGMLSSAVVKGFIYKGSKLILLECRAFIYKERQRLAISGIKWFNFELYPLIFRNLIHLIESFRHF